MLPAFLLPETESRQDGVGPAISLRESGRLLQLTLEIRRVLEQETLEVFLAGSADGSSWRELAMFPPKSYCGTYSAHLNLNEHPDVKHLRVEWRMSRWSGRREAPLFGFHVYAQEAKYAGAA